MVVPPEPMVKRIRAYTEGQEDHSSLKSEVVDDIHTEQGQGGINKGKDRTVDRTRYRGCNS